MDAFTDLTPGEYRALAEFRYQILCFLKFSEHAASVEGLEVQQHQFLLAVRAESETVEPTIGPTIGRIAERLLIHHHSAVGLTDRLEGRGLLQRVRNSDDRRQVRLRLTLAGSEILVRLSAIHRRELEKTGPELVAALQFLLKQELEARE